jgi:hypothetical protein
VVTVHWNGCTCLHVRMVAGRVVVEDQMDPEPFRDFAIDRPPELLELDVAVATVLRG